MTVVLGPAVRSTRTIATLGEGSRWHARTGQLLWVDIEAGRLFREYVDETGGLTRMATYEIGLPVGAAAPVDGLDGWIVAAGRGFVYLADSGATKQVAATVAGPGTRMNDGACDREGRFWAGSLADDHRPGAGMLHVLDRDGTVHVVLRDLTIPNGIGWSPDGSTAYLVDSGHGAVFAFDTEASGSPPKLGSRRVLVQLTGDEGVPDGLTVDQEGCLWAAIYGGSEVRRYAPGGGLLERVPIPVRQVTSCCFGGPGGTTLFVTTAREGFGEAEALEEPHAGSVFAVPTRMTAPPVAEFRPAHALAAALASS